MSRKQSDEAGVTPGPPLLTPQWMNALIDEYTGSTYFRRSRRHRRLEDYFPAIRRLQEWFLGVKQSRGKRTVPKGYLQQPEYRAAYLLYFAQLNALRFQGMCRHLLLRSGAQAIWDEILQRDTVRVLDVGSGPGSATWGWWYFLQEHFPQVIPNVSLNIRFLDQSAKVLEDAVALARPAAAGFRSLSVAKLCRNVRQKSPQGRYDVILASFALNELPAATSHRLVAHLLSRCLDKGLLLILSPAKSFDSKRLTGLRERMLAESPGIRVVAPCLHQSGCPLASPARKDFCHFQTRYPVDLGTSFLKVRNYLRARERGSKRPSESKFLNYSYLALTNLPASDQPLETGQRLIISEPQRETESGITHRICLPGKAGTIYSPRPLFRGFYL